MNFAVNFQVAGKYKFRRLRNGIIVQETDWFSNLITNTGLDLFGTVAAPTSLCTACFVGTGNTSPAITNTTLTAYLANTTTVSSSAQSFVSATPSYYTITYTYTFAVGVATGTLAEVGIGNIVSSNPFTYNLFSHALIVDSVGSPTTITVLSNESLEVLYQLELFNDTTTNTYSTTISGVAYTGSYLLYSYGGLGISSAAWQVGVGALPASNQAYPELNYFNGGLTTLTGSSPTGTHAGSQQIVTASTYTSGSYTITYTFSEDVGHANLPGGITVITFDYAMGAYQFSVSPAIPKDSNHTMTLQFSVTWGRYP